MQTSSEVVPTKKTIATTTLLMTPTPTSSSTDDHSSTAVIKRKQRTKRPRPSVPASSSESTTTEEEEDMAHCLILLAAGAAHASDPSPAVLSHQSQAPPPRAERYTSRKYTEAAATPDGVRAGFYVYECKTCNKCFPTFQALGGHRASHKKPRLAAVNVDGTTTATTMTASPSPPPPLAVAVQPPPPPPPRQTTPIEFPPDVAVATALSLSSSVAAAATASGKPRAHECSICGAEFASGQALGGHMRRHRPLNAPDRAVTVATGNSSSKKEGINLELDLNLPAPSDEEAVVSLLPPPAVMLGLGQFNDGSKAGHMLTASALVDCHY